MVPLLAAAGNALEGGVPNIDVPVSYWMWFFAGVSFLLTMDILLHRKAHRIRTREAIAWTIFWIGLAVAFNVWIGVRFGPEKAMEFAAGYLIEEALSVDNLFVFMVIFRYFKVKPEYQHRILFWGILGAIVLRLLFVLAGTELIQRWKWVMYIFGALLILSGIKLLRQKDEDIDPEKNWGLRLFKYFIPTTNEFEGPKFLVKRDGRTYATPLLLVLVVVETTDVVFAVDSVPAVIAITTDRFIVFTSNIFAILGLRSIYFVLAGMMDIFHHLKVGLSLVLVFVGIKMILAKWLHIPVAVSLAVVGSIIGSSIVASLVLPHEKHLLPPDEAVPEPSPESLGAPGGEKGPSHPKPPG